MQLVTSQFLTELRFQYVRVCSFRIAESAPFCRVDTVDWLASGPRGYRYFRTAVTPITDTECSLGQH